MSESIPAKESKSHETDAIASSPKTDAVVQSDTAAHELSYVADVPGSAGSAMRVPGKLAGGKETGGPEGPEPTRYGDWERKGRCIDF